MVPGAGETLSQGLTARDQFRVAAQQAQRGAAWQAVNPSLGLGTEFSNDEGRMLLRFWLGAPLVPPQWQGAACPLCGQILDTLGDHMVCCNKNQLKQRHTYLQGALADLAQLAGIPVSMEVALPDGSVPGDVCFRQWDADGPLMVDVTFRHPTPVGSAPHRWMACVHGSRPRKQKRTVCTWTNAAARATPSPHLWCPHGAAWDWRP